MSVRSGGENAGANGKNGRRYRIANPHDDYGFVAPDDDVAAVAVGALGALYAWTRGDETGPMWGFIQEGTPEEETAAALVRRVLDERPQEVIAAWRSVEIKGEQRERLGVDPDAWHDEMRSSVTDLRAHAQQLADKLEASLTGRSDASGPQVQSERTSNE